MQALHHVCVTGRGQWQWVWERPHRNIFGAGHLIFFFLVEMALTQFEGGHKFGLVKILLDF